LRIAVRLITIFVILSSFLVPVQYGSSPAIGSIQDSLILEIVSNADLIASGTVTDLWSAWNDDRSHINTAVVLSIESIIKGDPNQNQITINVPGGQVNGLTERVSGNPEFLLGENVLVFLTPSTLDSDRQEKEFRVYRGFQGKYRIESGRIGPISFDQLVSTINDMLVGKPFLESTNLSLQSSLDSSYSLSGLSWPHPPNPSVSFRINENTSDCTGEGSAVQSAASTWNGAFAKFSFTYGGGTSASAPTQNYVNEVMWGETVNDNALAETTIWYLSNQQIVECDLVFNDDFSWSTASTPAANKYDVQSIALHEFGHFLNLNDLYSESDSSRVLSISEMGHFLNRTLLDNQVALTSSLRPRL